jgi:hypothetical protein
MSGYCAAGINPNQPYAFIICRNPHRIQGFRLRRAAIANKPAGTRIASFEAP